MNAIYKLHTMNPADYEDMTTAMCGVFDYMTAENIACQFLRKMYGIEVYDIHNDEDMKEAMEAHGYGDTCDKIVRICGIARHTNLFYGKDGFERYAEYMANQDLCYASHTNWSDFCRKAEEFAATTPAMSPVLAVVHFGWTAETVAEYCY